MRAKPHILVADDSRTIATALALSLRKSGFDVTVTHCGEDALRVARGKRFDLVLSDNQMLEMSGIDLCRQLRAQPSYQGTPFVLLTAADLGSDDDRLRNEAGITLIMNKPFSPARVVEVARHYTSSMEAVGNRG